jgi:hypothetical protein
MSFFTKPIAASARSVAIAALLGATMLASPLTAARADTAANGTIQLAQGYPYYGYTYPYAYPYAYYGYPYYGYGWGGGGHGGWHGGGHGGGGHGGHHR